jgi:hypothetical protein
MAVPAPAIPTGNAYTINVARPSHDDSALTPFALAGAHLLRRWKIPVRMHLAGDTPSLNALRARLNEAGARPSAFSPAPSSEVPGEGFWKTTTIVVEFPASSSHDAPPFWAMERDDKKVDWDPLLIALGMGLSPDTLPASVIRKPDLWIVTAPENAPEQGQGPGVEDIAWSWSRAGAGAVCVLGAQDIAWHTGNAAFGQSHGVRGSRDEAMALPVAPRASDAGGTARTLGTFAAGVAAGLMRDLLSENLFDKTLLRADRECLEMRPLRMGRAAIEGLAALEALTTTPSPDRYKGLTERAEACRVALQGPESRPWAHKGR